MMDVQVLRSGFCVPGSGFCVLRSAFRVLRSGFCIVYSEFLRETRNAKRGTVTFPTAAKPLENL